MKNCINLKPALLTMLLMVSLSGCTYNLNVVREISDIDGYKNVKMLLLRDVKTGEERICRCRYEGYDPNPMDYFRIGDTVKITKMYGKKWYNNKVLNTQLGLSLECDSLYKRMEQIQQNKEFEVLKQQFEKSK